jgi:localization factor PodJL
VPEVTAPEAELDNAAPAEQDTVRNVDDEMPFEPAQAADDSPAAETLPEEPAVQAKAAQPAEPAPGDEIPSAASTAEPQAEMDPVSTASASPLPEMPAFTVPVEAGPVALREAADAGDAKALFEIASRYADGRGVTADMKEAAKWYEKSAELGFAPAQYRIGNLYEKGVGVERDVQKSKTWYQLAAAQGNASAMHNLAVLFAMGADGTADNESAARWFTDAAELGVKDSQFNLGILAAKGVGMVQNLEESYKWFALVAKSGDRDASAKRDEIANALRPEQLERARAATELWKAKPLDPQSNVVDVPESWQESPDTTAGVDMKKAVQNIQSILNKNGYDAGGADGVMGEKTKTAIIAFQKDNDMAPTGEIDEKLVRALIARK